MIPNKIFIIPYRQREPQKKHFEVYMEYILEDISSNEYEIFFVHQQDNKPFNRGAMKNIGFLAIKNKYPNNYKDITFIFNDIDTMPATKNLLNYNTTHGIIKHYYGFTFALGGIFAITGADFEKCEGFPNLWGWGLEDNCIYKRALKCNIKIDRSNFYTINNKNIIHIFDGLRRTATKQDVWRVNDNADTVNDIKNLKYTINNEYINVTEFTTKINHTTETYYMKDLTITPTKIIKDIKFNPFNNLKTNNKNIIML